MISLQVKYSSSNYMTGDVIAIRPVNFEYKEGDCKSAWLAAGRPEESYKKTFAIIYISDCEDAETTELTKLIQQYSDDIAPPFKRKYFLRMPEDYNDAHRVSMRKDGYTIAKLSEVIALTDERA
tara:strand:+ start:97 stop:468 length:372 start_codon:yes stop_codon:yes gene_type:complete